MGRCARILMDDPWKSGINGCEVCAEVSVCFEGRESVSCGSVGLSGYCEVTYTNFGSGKIN